MYKSSADLVIDWMTDAGVPITRENFIDFNWLGNPPDPWTAEDEMELPTFLQSSSDAGFGEDSGKEEAPRDHKGPFAIATNGRRVPDTKFSTWDNADAYGRKYHMGSYGAQKYIVCLHPDADLASDDWVESEHPRGQPGNAGEFGPGGGGNKPSGEKSDAGKEEHKAGGGGEGGGADPQHEHTDGHNTRLETGAPLSHEIVSRMASAAAAAQAIKPTNTINTPERTALRAKIADDLYRKDIGKRVKGHEATIILGLPGAGKSTFANPLLNAGALEIDPDLAKERLPEFNHGLGAMATHEESSDITREVLKKALAAGDNIVWPRINSPEKIEADMRSLKRAGYKVNVRFVDVDHEVAINSVINRFLATGRFVPPSTIDAIGDKAAKAYEVARSSGLADSYERHKRNPTGGFTKETDA